MLNDADKKNILDFLLKKISDISSKEYQTRVWIQGKGPEWDDFSETVCCFFSDADPIIESYKEFGITDEQNLILKRFRDEFDAFSSKHHEAFEFIDTPEWAEIMEKAKEVLKAFNYIKKPFSSGPQ